LEIQAAAHVEGDLSSPSLFIEEGAVFEGNCQMEEAGKIVDLNKVREN